MSPTKIKICGLRREADIACVNGILPEYIGFVFAPGSRRYVSPERAGALRSRLDPRIVPVGVFVNTPVDAVARLLQTGIVDIAQLHGQEDDAYINALRRRTDAPILKAFGIRGPADIAAARRSAADYILLDSGAGGTGARFDWSFIAGLDRPFFLAGGLNPENVAEAVGHVRPYAVDVSSGVETGTEKDLDKMRRFVSAVRAI